MTPSGYHAATRSARGPRPIDSQYNFAKVIFSFDKELYAGATLR